MNENLKYGLFFLGGVALGAVGAVAVSRGKLDLKPFATEPESQQRTNRQRNGKIPLPAWEVVSVLRWVL